MLKPGIKRLAVFLMLSYVFFLETSYTDADIFAERNVKNNKFSAITLDFSTRNSFNNALTTSLFSSLGIQPNGFDLRAARVIKEAGVYSKYRLKTVKTNGDDLFCNRLKIKVLSRDFSRLFSGSLLDLSVTSNFNGSDPRDFIFFVSLDDEDQELKNKICEFNFDFKTYRDDPSEQGGIFAERLISNVISSGSW